MIVNQTRSVELSEDEICNAIAFWLTNSADIEHNWEAGQVSLAAIGGGPLELVYKAYAQQPQPSGDK